MKQRRGNGDIVRSRPQVEGGPSQETVIGGELKKTRGEHFPLLGQVESSLIEDHVMAGAFGPRPYPKLGASPRQFLQTQAVKVIQRQRLGSSFRRGGIFNGSGHADNEKGTRFGRRGNQENRRSR